MMSGLSLEICCAYENTGSTKPFVEEETECRTSWSLGRIEPRKTAYIKPRKTSFHILIYFKETNYFDRILLTNANLKSKNKISLSYLFIYLLLYKQLRIL